MRTRWSLAAAAILSDRERREAMGAAARAFHAAHQGAAERLWSWLAPPARRQRSPLSREGRG